MNEMVSKAEAVARMAHEGQLRRNGDPYITHPARMASTFVNELHATVAWLHDVIEDTSVTAEDLARDFPPEVVSSVVALTRRTEDEESYLDFILRAGRDFVAKKVKLADLNDNLRDLKPGSQRDKYELARWILENMELQ